MRFFFPCRYPVISTLHVEKAILLPLSYFGISMKINWPNICESFFVCGLNDHNSWELICNGEGEMTIKKEPKITTEIEKRCKITNIWSCNYLFPLPLPYSPLKITTAQDRNVSRVSRLFRSWNLFNQRKKCDSFIRFSLEIVDNWQSGQVHIMISAFPVCFLALFKSSIRCISLH